MDNVIGVFSARADPSLYWLMGPLARDRPVSYRIFTSLEGQC